MTGYLIHSDYKNNPRMPGGTLPISLVLMKFSFSLFIGLTEKTGSQFSPTITISFANHSTFYIYSA